MIVVSINLTTPYKENLCGTTALPFRLLKGRSDGVDTIIYTFNANGLTYEQIAEVERELSVEIRLLSLPRWYRCLFKFHLLFLRVFFKYPFVNFIRLPQSVVDEIKSLQPDLIWVNGKEMSRIVEQFHEFRCIQIVSREESYRHYLKISGFTKAKVKKVYRTFKLRIYNCVLRYYESRYILPFNHNAVVVPSKDIMNIFKMVFS